MKFRISVSKDGIIRNYWQYDIFDYLNENEKEKENEKQKKTK